MADYVPFSQRKPNLGAPRFRARAGKGVTPTVKPEPKSRVHLGARVLRGRWGFQLTRDAFEDFNTTPSGAREQMAAEFDDPAWFADTARNYTDATRRAYTDKVITAFAGPALRNYDLNMAFFDRLHPVAFEQALTDLLTVFPKLNAVEDITSLDGRPGVYVMVLDGYRQVYVGQSKNMLVRIKTHWAGMTALDRLIHGNESTSRLSVDVFQAFDTTRVFAVRTARHETLEARIEAAVPDDFRLNRVDGGALGSHWASHVNAARIRKLTP